MLLVAGIKGHSGRYFLQELIDNKYEGQIRCIVRKTSDTSMLDNSGLNIEKYCGDLNDKDFVRRAMNGMIITIGKINYIEKFQCMGENRNYPHEEERRDFYYELMSFKKGIQIESKQYLEKNKRR